MALACRGSWANAAVPAPAATCHVWLSDEGLAALGPASVAEANILEFEDSATGFSRLSCQIRLSSVPEGLVLTIPGDPA